MFGFQGWGFRAEGLGVWGLGLPHLFNPKP